MRTPTVYLAAPLFNPREREFNEELSRAIEKHGKVFLPQRDGRLLTELIASGVDIEVAQGWVFAADVQAMRSSDLLVAVLDGAHVDDGVAFEIGFMNGISKMCIGLQTDVRRTLPSGNNPMISRGLHKLFSNAADLVVWVSQWACRNGHGLNGNLLNKVAAEAERRPGIMQHSGEIFPG